MKGESTVDEKRIYGRKVEIDTENTKTLYNNRAENLSNMESIYTSVLLGDQNPQYADEWNKVEKDLIFPHLRISPNSTVLDLGCGIGRWAETIMPICKKYVGVDFSGKMVDVARTRCKEFVTSNKDFYECSVQDYFKSENLPKFDCIIISYVLMYINDTDMLFVINRMLEQLSSNAVIYFIDTVALSERLTLKEIYSEAMHTNYSALYRTVEEYESYYDIFRQHGFKNVISGFMPKLNNEKHFSETDRYYTVMER